MEGRGKHLSLCSSFCVLVLAVASAWAYAAEGEQADGIERLLPASTHFYVSFKNPAGKPGWQESALYKIAHDEEMKAFLDNARQEYGRLKERFRAQLPFAPELLEEALSKELTYAFTGMRTTADGRQEFGLVTVMVFKMPPVEAERAAVAALRKVAKGMIADPQPAFQHKDIFVKHMAMPMGALYYAIVDGRFVMTTGELSMREMLKLRDGEGASLAADPTFRTVMKKIGGQDGTLTAYFNSALFFTQFGQFMPPQQVAVFEAMGLYKVKAVGFCSRFADGGIRDSVYVLAPGERGGLMPVAGNPADLSLLKQVPQDATLVSLSRVDLKDLYVLLMRMMANTDPRQFERATRDITEFEQKAGFKIGADLLGSVGTQWLMYQSPHESVMIVEMRDAKKFQTCLGGLLELAEGKAVWQQMDYKGARIDYLAVKEKPFPAAPCYSIVGNYAVFALYPQTLKSYLSRRGKEGPSILDKEDFKRVAGKFMKGCDSVGYVDIGSNLPECYNLLVMASPMLYGVKEVSLRPELLPHPDVLKPHMFGLGSGRINDQEGILWEWYSPVGAAGQVLGLVGAVGKAVTGSTGVVNSSLLASVLLPALAKARGEARRTACMSNLKQVGMGCAMFMADNGDQLPEKLEDVMKGGYLPAQVLVCPQDKKPMQVGGIKTSYYYVGRLAAVADGQVIIAYEKGGLHGNDRNVLFADFHGQGMTEEALKVRLRQSLDALKAKDWDKVPHARRIEIEAFYAGK